MTREYAKFVSGKKKSRKKVINEIIQTINKVKSGYELQLFTKIEVNLPNGLEGVRGHTYIQINKQMGYQYYNIDFYNIRLDILLIQPRSNCVLTSGSTVLDCLVSKVTASQV